MQLNKKISQQEVAIFIKKSLACEAGSPGSMLTGYSQAGSLRESRGDSKSSQQKQVKIIGSWVSY